MATRAGEGAPVISVQSISKDYGGLKVLENISFSVSEGEFLGVVGPSGSGKTTLLKILGGLLKPCTGRVLLRETEAHLARRKGEVGFVFQNPVLLPWRSVYQNINLPLELLREPDAQDIDSMIDLVGLKDFAQALPNELSGGMQQRVALARALIFHPSVLLMDEPFGAVDELTRERLNLELMTLWSKLSTTVVLVTHSVPEVVLMSDRVLVLSKRPAKISGIIAVELPHPRDRNTRITSAYQDTVEKVRACLAD